jgi:hypothetical protein
MIRLPATPETILREVVVPALVLLPTKMDTPEARVMLLFIGGQETGFAARRQHGNGPARGLFQFEVSGVKEVLTRTQTASIARAVLVRRGHQKDTTPAQVLDLLEHDDILAAAFARLYLWVGSAAPLPKLGDQKGAELYYVRVWRPGKHRPDDCLDNYSRALSCACTIPQEE